MMDIRVESKNQDRNRLLVSLLLIAAAVLVAVVGMRNFVPFETEVFERLMLAFGETEEALKIGISNSRSADMRSFLSILLSVLFAVAGLWLGWKVSLKPTSEVPVPVFVPVLVQVFVLSLVCNWAAWKYLSVSLTPVTFLASLSLALTGGYAMRKWDADNIAMQTQFYKLKLRNNELRDVRLQMVRQDEVERRMLAADLHDQVLNDMKRLRKKFEAYAKERSDEGKEEIDQLLAATMVEIREVMDSLCPSALEHLGLTAALEDCARKAGEKGGFKVRCKSKIEDSDAQKLSMVEQSLLYRLAQEALTNVIKHAEAKTVRVNSDMDGDNLVVTIADDGKGIPEGKLSEDSRGLRYMRQRADLIGATISFRAGETANSPGTVVEIRVDLAGRKAVESSGS